MKWNGMGRGAKALAVSLALILGVTACSRDYTVAYLYVTAATKTTTGLIDGYEIDYQTGALSPLADSPIPSGGRNPVAIVAMPDGSGLFVLNHDDSTVVAFNVGTDGKIYQQAVYNTTGTFPTSAAVDSQGKFLYVTYTYQSGFTTASPGAGGLTVFPITEATNPNVVTLGTGVNYNLGTKPVGITVGNSICRADQSGATYTTSSCTVSGSGAAGHKTIPYVFAVDQEISAASVPIGVIRVFQQNQTTGALTAIAGNLLGGFAAGTLPGAIAVDPQEQFVYVTDQSTNQVYGNTIVAGGGLSPMNSSPFATGQLPMGLTIDPRGSFLYVANYNSNTISTYAIDAALGALTSAGTTSVATGPTCVTVEPALGIYLYSSNYIDNSVSGEQLNPHTGALTGIQGTQFSASALPTCTTAIANGQHATQVVTQ